MGPPSSGGILLVLMLNMIDEIIKVNGYDLSGLKFNSKEYVHLITEVERRAYADRATHLGDEDFWEVIDQLKEAGAEDILVCPIEKMVL